MDKISCEDKKKNEEVLDAISEERSLAEALVKRKKELDWTRCKRGEAVETGSRGKNGRKETERSTEVGDD